MECIKNEIGLENNPEDFKGKRMVNGWKNSGAPWTTDLDPKPVCIFGK